MTSAQRDVPTRPGERTVWLLVAAAAVALAAAIGFALWLNSAPPLHPVPVASRPSA